MAANDNAGNLPPKNPEAAITPCGEGARSRSAAQQPQNLPTGSS